MKVAKHKKVPQLVIPNNRHLQIRPSIMVPQGLTFFVSQDFLCVYISVPNSSDDGSQDKVQQSKSDNLCTTTLLHEYQIRRSGPDAHIDIRSKEDETTYPLVCWLFNRYAQAIHAINTMLSKAFSVFSLCICCFSLMW